MTCDRPPVTTGSAADNGGSPTTTSRQAQRKAGHWRWRRISSTCRPTTWSAGWATRWRLRRRDEVSARHRGPAGVDVARAHPQERLEGSRGRRVATRTPPTGTALIDAPMLGVAYGYCGAPDQWWQQQVVAGLRRGRRRPVPTSPPDDELLRTHRAAHPSRARRAAASARRWPAGCSTAAASPTCCCRRRRSTARPTGRGGCTAARASPTSSAATTSPAIPRPFAILGRLTAALGALRGLAR